MNKRLTRGFIFLTLCCSLLCSFDAVAAVAPIDTTRPRHPEKAPHETLQADEPPQGISTAPETEAGEKNEESHGGLPAAWSVIPFILLLAMIATGPLFYPHFWHKYYPVIAAGLGLIVILYYVFVLHNAHQPIHSLAEYVSFIALIASLFVASGGILIEVDKEGKPLVNLLLLIFGAAVANIIGTTGASMLLIRPFIRLNKGRVQPYHIVFFIFMVSNVGGCLTPIGDPPLFLGFLKGVPFFWTAEFIWPFWFVGIAIIGLIFYVIDKRQYQKFTPVEPVKYSGRISIRGVKNIGWLAVVIGAVFLDPNVVDWIPAIVIDGTKFSYIREVIMLATAFLAYKTANPECLKGNEFDFEPIKEVAYLFIGIFATMMPALALIGSFAASGEGQKLVTVNSLYWITGALSGVLDNAPTYLNFLSAGMGKLGLSIDNKLEVLEYSQRAITELVAISVGAVFFGAFTYIGNAPNFMVKSIAEQTGIRMPSFVGYIIRYSIPILLPVLFVVWLVFFHLLS
ncbi:MAG: sodium:proton antiporter [Bacteroidia bacterium]